MNNLVFLGGDLKTLMFVHNSPNENDLCKDDLLSELASSKNGIEFILPQKEWAGHY